MFNNVDWIGCSTYVLQIRKILEEKQPDGLRRFAYEYMTSPYEYHSALQPSRSAGPFICCLSQIWHPMKGDAWAALTEKSKPIKRKSLYCRRWACHQGGCCPAGTLCPRASGGDPAREQWQRPFAEKCPVIKSLLLLLQKQDNWERLQHKSLDNMQSKASLRRMVRTQKGTVFRNFSVN